MTPEKLTASVAPFNPADKISGAEDLLTTLPLVRRIASARLHRHYRAAVDDLVQTVVLNLWSWQQRGKKRSAPPVRDVQTGDDTGQMLPTAEYPAQNLPADQKLPEKSGSPDKAEIADKARNQSLAQSPAQPEDSVPLTADLDQTAWLKIASRATRNEINSFYARKYHREVLSGTAEEIAAGFSSARDLAYQIGGTTRLEADSLLAAIWGELQSFSLRRRYALLLNKDEFIDELIGSGICSMDELARFFAMDKAELLRVVAQLPLADEQIKELVAEKTGMEATVKQIWTWRAKAKLKLAAALAVSTRLILFIGLLELLENIPLMSIV